MEVSKLDVAKIVSFAVDELRFGIAEMNGLELNDEIDRSMVDVTEGTLS